MDEYSEDCEVEVLGDAVWRGNNIVSDGDWRRLEIVLRLLPGPVTNNSSGSAVPKQPRGSLRSELLQEHPWLADVWAKEGHRSCEEITPGIEAKDSGGKAGHNAKDTEASSDDDFSDETALVEAEEVLDAIDANTCQMRNSAHGIEGPFAWRMMSAAASSCYPGEGGATSFRGDARTSHARQFASTYSLQSSASFVSNLCTEELAKALAEFWVAKMTHYYEIWVVSSQEHHAFF